MKNWSKKEYEKITGKKLPKRKYNMIPKSEPKGIQFIKSHLKYLGVDFVEEHRFHHVRRFRFDLAVLNMKLGVEYEGLISEKSRHTTVDGYSSDCTKYNLAQKEGWIVLRYTVLNYNEFPKDFNEINK